MGNRDAATGRLRGAGRSGQIRDLVGVYVLGLGALTLVLLGANRGGIPQDVAVDLLVLATVALGAAAALLGDVSARLSGDVRPSWIAAALALHTLIVVPSTTVRPEIHEGDPAVVVAARLAAFVAILVLLLVAVRPPERLGNWAPWLGAGTGAWLSVGVAHGASSFPAVFATLSASPWPAAGVILAWVLVSGWLVIGGLLRRDPTVWWMGLGLLLVAVSHGQRVLYGIEFDEPGLVFGAVQLFGMLTVLVGTLQLVKGGVQAARTEHEELWLAATCLQRAGAEAAERDHELRNGLAGLSGITQLLGSADAEQEELRSAVLRELARLAAMVEADQVREPERAAVPQLQESFEVTPLLADAVMLRRAAGARIELESPSELRAAGPPEVLAQVVGNLLANCERHAPGAMVGVRACAVGPRIRVEVSDDGPGIAPGRERSVLERGVRGSGSDGQGLGLHLSRTLLDGVGGSLCVLPRAGGGCTVTVELPRWVPGARPPEPVGDVAPAVTRGPGRPVWVTVLRRRRGYTSHARR